MKSVKNIIDQKLFNIFRKQSLGSTPIDPLCGPISKWDINWETGPFQVITLFLLITAIDTCNQY